MKHGEGKEEARELYCYQQMTFAEIAERTGRNEKTVRAWADADGWKQARGEIVCSRAATREKLHVLIDKLADRLAGDAAGGADFSPHSIHALVGLVNAVKGLQNYDSKAAETGDAGVDRLGGNAAGGPATPATPEEIAARVAAIMGG
jgi:hypothetical protein